MGHPPQLVACFVHSFVHYQFLLPVFLSLYVSDLYQTWYLSCLGHPWWVLLGLDKSWQVLAGPDRSWWTLMDSYLTMLVQNYPDGFCRDWEVLLLVLMDPEGFRRILTGPDWSWQDLTETEGSRQILTGPDVSWWILTNLVGSWRNLMDPDGSWWNLKGPGRS